jgi:hypothetical protein
VPAHRLPGTPPHAALTELAVDGDTPSFSAVIVSRARVAKVKHAPGSTTTATASYLADPAALMLTIVPLPD